MIKSIVTEYKEKAGQRQILEQKSIGIVLLKVGQLEYDLSYQYNTVMPPNISIHAIMNDHNMYACRVSMSMKSTFIVTTVLLLLSRGGFTQQSDFQQVTTVI